MCKEAIVLTLVSLSLLAEVPAQQQPGQGHIEHETSCRLVYCQTDYGKVLIFDLSGKMITSARSVMIRADKIGEAPIVACTVYDGVFAPTTPTVKTWSLDEIKLVDAAEFQKMIDQAVTQPATPEKLASPPMPQPESKPVVTPLNKPKANSF